MIPSSRFYPFFSKIRGDFSVFIIFRKLRETQCVYILRRAAIFFLYRGLYRVNFLDTPRLVFYRGVGRLYQEKNRNDPSRDPYNPIVTYEKRGPMLG